MQMGTWVELFIRAVLWAEPPWFPILLCNLLPHLHSNARQLFASYWFSQMGKHLFNFIHFDGAFDLHLERGREYVKSGHSFRELIIEPGGPRFRWQFPISFRILLLSASCLFLYITSILTNEKITCVNEGQFLKTQCSYHNDVNETSSMGFFFLTTGKCQLEWELEAPGDRGFKDNEQQGSLRRLFGYLGCILTSGQIPRI